MALSGAFLALEAKKKKEAKRQYDLQKAFNEADKTKSGKLSLDEWTAFLQKNGHDVNRYLPSIICKH